MNKLDFIKGFFEFLGIVLLALFICSYCPKSKELVDVYVVPAHYSEDTLFVSVNGVLVPYYVNRYHNTSYKGKYFVVLLNDQSGYIDLSIDYDTYISFLGDD